MRQTLLAAAAAFVIGGIATGAVLSQAQPAPPPAPGMDGAPAPGHHWMGHHPGPGQEGPGKEAHAWMHRRAEMMRAFALVYRQPDRALTTADVQKVAEAFLLWNGNHTWKVTNVAASADGPIGFSYATPDGSVIAKFTMDPHTGHVQRVG